MRHVIHRIKRGLEYEHFSLFLIIIIFVLKVPTLDNSIEADDFQQRNIILGSEQLHQAGIPANAPNTDLLTVLSGFFAFAPGNDDTIQEAKRYGLLPWWTNDELKVSFFRPITAFTHWLDYQLWPNTIEMMRAHNLIWFLLTLSLVALTYRRFMSSYAVASLALFIYAVDPSYNIPVFWLANRNVFIALVFSLLTLYLHDRGRCNDKGYLIACALCCLALSLLSAEAGIGTMAFIIAYELCLAKDPWTKRVFFMAAYGGIVVLWRILYTSNGFGASGTGLYVDPSDTGLFIQNLFIRFPLFIAEQLTGFDGIDNMLSLEATRSVSYGALIFILLVALLALPMLKDNANARFWFIATILAAIPISAVTKTHGRLTLYVGIGGSALIVEYIIFAYTHYAKSRLAIWQKYANKTIAAYFALFHFLAGPILLILIAVSYTNNRLHHGFRLSDAMHKRINIGVEESANKNIILINNPDPHGSIFIPYIFDYFNKKIPTSIRTLAPAYNNVTVTRVSQQSLLLSDETPFPIYPDAKIFNDTAWSGLYGVYALAVALRGNIPFTKESYYYNELDIHITDLMDGYPREIRVDIKKPISDPQFRWLYWDWRAYKYQVFELPEIGQSLLIEGPHWLKKP